MGSDRMKKAAEWFYGNIFRDEAIRPREVRKEERLPLMLRTARSLESSDQRGWQSRESIFLKQAKLLASYEDNYDFQGSVVRYYPTYQSLTDQELRGYFSWRTRLRRGEVLPTSLSFAFLYIYELINQIGVTDPMDGYGQLTAFRDSYGRIDESICSYVNRWLTDYVIYYGLDPNLLADSPQVLFHRSITVLDHIREQEDAKVIWAVKQLSPKWLERSKFYGAYREDCDAVIVRVLRRMSEHYATRCKKTMTEQYFGKAVELQVRLFDTAVFCDPLKIRNCEYAPDELCVYRCKNGLWTVTKPPTPVRSGGKLADLLKTIDAMMRQAYHYRHPIKSALDTKWILKIITEEIDSLLAGKKAAEEKKITIDYSRLSQIRRDAAITREKLIVEEEWEDEPPAPVPEPQPEPENDTPLTPPEYRLLQCLLYGADTHWVQAEGHILSVLLDGINDKLYDVFMDSVVDDIPAVIEDYIDDLKEMVHP